MAEVVGVRASYEVADTDRMRLWARMDADGAVEFDVIAPGVQARGRFSASSAGAASTTLLKLLPHLASLLHARDPVDDGRPAEEAALIDRLADALGLDPEAPVDEVLHAAILVAGGAQA